MLLDSILEEGNSEWNREKKLGKVGEHRLDSELGLIKEWVGDKDTDTQGNCVCGSRAGGL